MLELLGMTSSCQLVPQNWMVLWMEFNHASSDLVKHVQPAMESVGFKWFPADTEVGGLVHR